MADRVGSQLLLAGGSAPVRFKAEPKGFVVVTQETELRFWPKGWVPNGSWPVQPGVYEVLDLRVSTHQGKKYTIAKIKEQPRRTWPCAIRVTPVEGTKRFSRREEAERYWGTHQSR